MKHKIVLYTLAYNESDIVDYAIDYWNALGVDKVICYNNYSTDDTVEKLKRFGNIVLNITFQKNKAGKNIEKIKKIQ